MFTGIVTAIGTVTEVEKLEAGAHRLTIASPWDKADLPLGASVACNGCCLTVTGYAPQHGFTVDVSPETAKITTLSAWEKNRRINLERGLKLGDPLDGHLVAGHVDGVGKIAKITPSGEAVEMTISYPQPMAPFLAKKGSVTVDGVSLTVNHVDSGIFSIMLIPHTLGVTTLRDLKEGSEVNLEADLVSRYVLRVLEARNP
ncbi:MAG: riboflavin synthase [Alphaproteobacteria bacterium]|nr:riboflavin synthase [Alphaproteobacteria bacterium]